MNIRPQLIRASGIDIHKNKVCVCFYSANKKEEVKEYPTFTCDLEQIRDDLLSQDIHDVLMESTGIYWIALYTILSDAGLNVRVVNPYFVKNMPKEKTDKKDAKWLTKLLVNNLVRNSFVVGEEQRAFRDLCRDRIIYAGHITQVHNRVLKNLERRNIKLRSVISNMDTKIADKIVNAIADGETDIEKMVAFCTGKVKKKKAEMRKALHGVIADHDRITLKRLQADISHYRANIVDVETQIATHTNRMSSELIADLQAVKGIGPKSTEIILAEIGDNVDAFDNCDKLAAWVGLAPGNKESAGKKFYSGTRNGNKTLRTTMIQVAWAAVRTKNSYWRSLYYHLTRRMPLQKAIVAVARKLIRVVYKIIKGQMKYVEYGGDYFAERIQARLAQKQNHNIVVKPA